MKVNIVPAFISREQGRGSACEKPRLKKETLASALRIARHRDVLRNDEWLDPVGYVLNMDAGKLSRPQARFELIDHVFLAFALRLLVVKALQFRARMANVFDLDVAFERAIFSERELGG